jgi:HAD superfamily hydrolase (TIGR01549 family)
MARRKFAAVVLDLYDTLVRWDPARLPEIEWRGKRFRSTDPFQIEMLAARLGADFDRERWLDAYHSTVAEIIVERDRDGIEITCDERFVRALRRFGLASDDRIRSLAQELRAIHMGQVRRVTAAPLDRIAAVRTLAPHFRLGLLSNFDDSDTGYHVLSDTGVRHLFEAVIISADVGIRKPNPRIFAQMLAMLGVAPEETLFVGDTPDADVTGPAGVGMCTAWITNGKGPWPEGLAAPDYVIENLTELPALLGC